MDAITALPTNEFDGSVRDQPQKIGDNAPKRSAGQSQDDTGGSPGGTPRVRVVQAEASPPWINKVAGPIIAVGTILLTFVLFYFVIFHDFDTNARKEIILYILGVLSAITTQIFSYYFGSSQGSAAKSRTIDSMLEAKQ